MFLFLLKTSAGLRLQKGKGITYVLLLLPVIIIAVLLFGCRLQ